MAYTTIDDPTKYFNTSIYTGTLKEDRPIVGTGFQPDLIWFKNRNTTNSHNILDSTRGVTKRLRTDDTSAEATTSTRLKSFDSDGMTISTDPAVNGSGNGIVAWQWKANGGTTSSLSGGDIGITTTSQANSTAKFSINTYTGSGSQSAIGHGLGVAPDFIMIKNRDQTDSWFVWHQELNNNQGLELDTNVATVTNNAFMGNEAPTSTVIGLGTGADTNESNETYVAYAFSEVQGYSKFGGYTGNGATDGPFVYTGFKPAWTMIKETGQTGSWYINDNKRDTFNLVDLTVYADLANAEATETNNSMDYLSNGFKLRGGGNDTNLDGGTYVYMAFAEAPFVTSNGTPNNAR